LTVLLSVVSNLTWGKLFLPGDIYSNEEPTWHLVCIAGLAAMSGGDMIDSAHEYC
jgi:hypothetical protein